LGVQGQAGSDRTTFCRECGKPIEADARFCRFCGKPQADRTTSTTTAAPSIRPSQPASGSRPGRGGADALEQWLGRLFPRHRLQDEFMHGGSIVAFCMALIGFVLGFFPAYSWLAANFLWAAIALLLFLMLRESTLSQIRARGEAEPKSAATGGRYETVRPTAGTPDLSAEAATTQSSPTPRQ
jgi:hypothetical protein